MRQFFLSAIALIISATLAHSQEFSVAQTDDVDAMPCSIFLDDSSFISLKEGASLSFSVQPTNNAELFNRLAERTSRCRSGIADVAARAEAAQ